MIEEYIAYLKYEKNYSELTLDNYTKSIKNFELFISQRKKTFLTITKEDIREYMKYLSSLKYKNSTVSNILSALRSFYEYLFLKQQITVNYFNTMKNPKKEKLLPNFLNDAEIEKLLNFDTLNTKEEIRDKLILELLYASGMRVSELCNLKLKDVNISEKSIKVLGKGSKMRITYFGDYAAAALESYLNVRESFLKKNKSCDYLFINHLGEGIKRSSVTNILNKRLKKIALGKNVSPHTLRHTFATHMLENGADVRSVQELLGHENLSTTCVYTHLTSDYLRREYLDKMSRK